MWRNWSHNLCNYEQNTLTSNKLLSDNVVWFWWVEVNFILLKHTFPIDTSPSILGTTCSPQWVTFFSLYIVGAEIFVLILSSSLNHFILVFVCNKSMLTCSLICCFNQMFYNCVILIPEVPTFSQTCLKFGWLKRIEQYMREIFFSGIRNLFLCFRSLQVAAF